MIAVVVLVLALAAAGLAALFGAGPSGDLPLWEIVTLIGMFLVFFGAGVYVAAVLGVIGIAAGLAFSDRPFWNFAGQIIWGPSTNFVLVSVPLFLLMGEILLRAGLSARLYRAMQLWLGPLPGGLLHTNIATSAVFSAISGSSVATAATMGSVALPYFEKTRYHARDVLGSLAAGGALGNLIPPGITFIVYGLITETSVGALYLAALGPSVLVTLAFMAWIAVRGRRMPAGADSPAGMAPAGLGVRLASLLDLLPIAALIMLVLGTIYIGWATPTEAAALGLFGAIALAAASGSLSLRMLHDSVQATARTTAMIGLILLGAYLLNFILGSMRIPQMVASTVQDLPLPGWVVMLCIIGLYLALGTFMEGFSMIITTIPVIFPVVHALGYDPIWFGVVVTMLIEIAQISPPDGTVLYVLQGLRRDGGSIGDVFMGTLPFVLIYIAAVLLLLVVPEIATWLPAQMM